VALATAGVIGTGAVVAGAGDTVESYPTTEQMTRGHSQSAVTGVERDSARRSASCGGDGRARTRCRPPPRAKLDGPSAFGKNVDLARAIRTPNGTGFIPARDTICIAIPDAGEFGMACNATATAGRAPRSPP
jgi:hypothetical protein